MQTQNCWLPQSAQLVDKRKESHDTFTLVLKSDLPFHFQSGQFNMLYAFGVGEAAVSIADQDKNGHILHSVRAVGPTTRALCQTPVGGHIGLRGPFGSHWPHSLTKNQEVHIIAGGLGLAPLRHFINYCLSAQSQVQSCHLYIGARTPHDLIYLSESIAWQKQLGPRYFLTVDNADRQWKGHVGFINTLLPRSFDTNKTIVICCGPEIMMRVCAEHFIKRGLPDNKIFVSLERNMKCGVGSCGHCQLGPEFLCKNGPVFSYQRVRHVLGIREL